MSPNIELLHIVMKFQYSANLHVISVIKMFQSGAVLTKDRTGGSDQEKLCLKCNVKEDIEHLLKVCDEFKEERFNYQIRDDTTMEMILQFKDRNKAFTEYLCSIFQKRFCVV